MSHLLAVINNPVINKTLGTDPSFFGGGFAPGIAGQVLQGLISVGFIIGGITFVFMLLIGGYSYISSGGDKDAAQKAARTLTQAIIGIVILLSVFVILNVLNILFGINLISFNFPTL